MAMSNEIASLKNDIREKELLLGDKRDEIELLETEIDLLKKKLKRRQDTVPDSRLSSVLGPSEAVLSILKDNPTIWWTTTSMGHKLEEYMALGRLESNSKDLVKTAKWVLRELDKQGRVRKEGPETQRKYILKQ